MSWDLRLAPFNPSLIASLCQACQASEFGKACMPLRGVQALPLASCSAPPAADGTTRSLLELLERPFCNKPSDAGRPTPSRLASGTACIGLGAIWDANWPQIWHLWCLFEQREQSFNSR
mmetsp:Transcript_84787/g.150123  ORF Transcript_84787/g.150123 Transcript_84787/m.150123 type:complete len:119 (+) Transcript_84787:452-808(+)